MLKARTRRVKRVIEFQFICPVVLCVLEQWIMANVEEWQINAIKK